MNRQEFLTVLIKELKGIEPSELQNILQYYNEYLDDAGKENELDAIRDLGSPQKIAAQIRVDSATRYMEQKPNGGKKTGRAVWTIIGWIFAAPIALPIALALAIIAFALFICIIAVFICFFVTALAFGIVGIVGLIGTVVVLPASPIASLSLLGTTLISLALCILIFIPSVRFIRFAFTKLGLWLSRRLFKKNKNDDSMYSQPQPQPQPQPAYAAASTKAEPMQNAETAAVVETVTETVVEPQSVQEPEISIDTDLKEEKQ